MQAAEALMQRALEKAEESLAAQEAAELAPGTPAAAAASTAAQVSLGCLPVLAGSVSSQQL